MRLFKRKPKKLKVDHFTTRWKELQKLCSSRKTWPHALIEADDLLDEALRKSKYKGKTTGERLVSAARVFTSGDTVWVGHKLRKKVSQEEVDVRTLRKKDMVIAMSGFRQALRDLGALKTDE